MCCSTRTDWRGWQTAAARGASATRSLPVVRPIQPARNASTARRPPRPTTSMPSACCSTNSSVAIHRSIPTSTPVGSATRFPPTWPGGPSRPPRCARWWRAVSPSSLPRVRRRCRRCARNSSRCSRPRRQSPSRHSRRLRRRGSRGRRRMPCRCSRNGVAPRPRRRRRRSCGGRDFARACWSARWFSRSLRPASRSSSCPGSSHRRAHRLPRRRRPLSRRSPRPTRSPTCSGWPN